ncbi:recombinase family protein [Paenibacillus polymyxa]|uniref:recombinase family protein n=1 Tax=Paenibacillus polymyxa TaxID=1406 RepID=UPI0020259DE1|nr:recombinase family protein [Paenibacillus polymyxa]URJ60919.1 recombinase family protein [Paenibacillus polymyxa]
MVIMGYARVSSKDQNPERQLIKFRELGIPERYIFVEKQSGKDFEREKYQAMRLMLREGDLLYLDALDRLGRNYDGIVSEWKYITHEVNADIVCLENEALFDSRKFKGMGDIGKLLEDQFLSMLAYVAEQERKKNWIRQAEGMQVARAAGVKFGRPKHEITPEFIEVYQEWKADKITARKAMKRIGMSNTTFYRRVSEYEA